MKYVIIGVIVIAVVVFLVKKVKKTTHVENVREPPASTIIEVCGALFQSDMADSKYINGVYNSVEELYLKDREDAYLFEEEFLSEKYVLIEDKFVGAELDEEDEEVDLVFGDSYDWLVASFSTNSEKDLLKNIKAIGEMNPQDTVLLAGRLKRFNDGYALYSCIVMMINGHIIER